MAADEQYAQALRELAAAKARIDKLKEACRVLLEWDRARNYIVPYRVRDPIIHALYTPRGVSRRDDETKQRSDADDSPSGRESD